MRSVIIIVCDLKSSAQRSGQRFAGYGILLHLVGPMGVTSIILPLIAG